jgi:hypothetical protein
MPSPYVNPSSYTGKMFESTPIAMRTEGALCGVLSGGGGGIYHGFDGNRARYDLSAYQNTYLPQTSGNHAMQRFGPYSASGGGTRRRSRRACRRSRRSRRACRRKCKRSARIFSAPK